ncbi:hypothetical protein RO3G_09801 [Lichtheimia corymbifera JMRC:FSU:9682]|uniref:Pre-rRNA-processing protein TSR2 n=1 Tax=Lichtheimia corymbifera JMRC:FSU:9682 TaxID=1263082 RepID=A0A068RG10_9FUNG|nr:hypothetical protein RO3G_09801 [Lichtheimia corymbifera JMRC:FSU:9682]
MADHPNKVAFEQGLHYVLRSWTALNLAVEQDWGGVESADKRDWMNQVLVDYFGANGKKLDVDDIEQILAQIMADEFHCVLEDDSPYLVAKHLVEIYHQCIHGNYQEVERLKQKYESRSNAVSSSRADGSSDDEDDNDVDNDQDDDDNDDDNAMDVDRSAPPEPEIDDDGFETVSYRKRR